MRFNKLLPLACLAVCGSMIASADSEVSTGGAAGNYTYVFNMPNGASYTLYTTGGPIGGSNSQGNGYVPVGSPDPSYSFDVQVGTGNTNNNGVFDVEILLQYNSIVSGYANTLDYYFTEPLSFWDNLGTQTFTPNATGTSGYDIYGVTDVTGYSSSAGYSFVYGDVYEGATYNYFTNSSMATDPGCPTCTVTTTFVPAVASPEPSSLALLSTGAAAAFGVLCRRRRSLHTV